MEKIIKTSTYTDDQNKPEKSLWLMYVVTGLCVAFFILLFISLYISEQDKIFDPPVKIYLDGK